MGQQYALHTEQRVDRIIPGTTHPYLGAIPTIGTIPLSEQKTGTITTEGVECIGTNTLFKAGGPVAAAVNVGDYIYYSGAIRRIKNIISDTYLELEYPFPANFANQTFVIVRKDKYSTIITRNSHASAAAIVQEASLAAGGTIITEGAPLSYNATGSTLEFTCSL